MAAEALPGAQQAATEMPSGRVAPPRVVMDNAVLFENLPDMLVCVERQTAQIRLCNKKWSEETGYAKAEFVGRPIRELYHEVCHEELEDALERFATTGEIRSAELFLKKKDGSNIPIILNVRSLQSVDVVGEVDVSLWSHACDLERERSHKKLLEELERSNEELERFAYVASHDLQEPLRMVASYTELLAERYEGKLDAKADKYIGYAVDGAKRMQRLISDLLALSRVGRNEQKFQNVDLGVLCAQAVSSLGRPIQDTGAKIEIEPLPTIRGDATQLERVFQNLIGNSLKYRGDQPPRIEIAAEVKADVWEISVADNGIGFKPKQAERVFEMFQRLQTRGQYPGTGIGLAIVKKIVRLHGGQIWANAAPHEGATFTFTLPRESESTAHEGGTTPAPE